MLGVDPEQQELRVNQDVSSHRTTSSDSLDWLHDPRLGVAERLALLSYRLATAHLDMLDPVRRSIARTMLNRYFRTVLDIFRSIPEAELIRIMREAHEWTGMLLETAIDPERMLASGNAPDLALLEGPQHG